MSKVINGVWFGVELGKVRSKNHEHVANVHLSVGASEDKVAFNIRGIMVYNKERVVPGENPVIDKILRFPGYEAAPGSKTKTSYVLVDQAVQNLIIEAVEKTHPDSFVDVYTGPKMWTIWGKYVAPAYEI